MPISGAPHSAGQIDLSTIYNAMVAVTFQTHRDYLTAATASPRPGAVYSMELAPASPENTCLAGRYLGGCEVDYCETVSVSVINGNFQLFEVKQGEVGKGCLTSAEPTQSFVLYIYFIYQVKEVKKVKLYTYMRKFIYIPRVLEDRRIG